MKPQSQLATLRGTLRIQPSVGCMLLYLVSAIEIALFPFSHPSQLLPANPETSRLKGHPFKETISPPHTQVLAGLPTLHSDCFSLS
jgi:hypothetical protein